ncbi:MAG: hypothetical protein ACLR8U_14415 [Oscillospiraceae bacterium]
MSEDEQYEFYEKFDSPKAFYEWKKKAEAAYDDNKNVIEVKPGETIDIGDLVGKN